MEQPRGMQLHLWRARYPGVQPPGTAHRRVSILSELAPCSSPLLTCPRLQPLCSSPARFTLQLLPGALPFPSFYWHRKQAGLSEELSAGPAGNSSRSAPFPLPFAINPPGFPKASSKKEIAQRPWRGDAGSKPRAQAGDALACGEASTPVQPEPLKGLFQAK